MTNRYCLFLCGVLCACLLLMTPNLLITAQAKSAPSSEPVSSVGDISWALRWYFTFAATEDVDRGYGTVTVDEHLELWQSTATGEWVLFTTESIDLACERTGDVFWEEEQTVVFTEAGYISCETVDLRTTTLTLSEGAFDICAGAESCELAINDVVNYVNVYPPSPEHPFLDGPLFVYEEVILGGAGTSSHAHLTTFTINQESMVVPVPIALVSSKFYLAIEQVAQRFNFKANNYPVGHGDVTQPYTYFNSTPETIYFGLNPATGELLTGSLINGIFDPYYSCAACPD